ncbi:hypothetical protein ACQ4PT_019311 [Festuca glaucescens]
MEPAAFSAAAPHPGAGLGLGGGGAVDEQQAAGVGILLQISMLVLSFVLGHLLRRRKFYYLPEASASLLIGMIVGGFANISNTQKSTRTMASMRTNSPGQNFVVVILRFLENFVGSMSSGIGVGLISALISSTLPFVHHACMNSLILSNLFKYAELGVENLHNLESCLFVLFPYFSYMLAEGLGLSGIVSILFTGIVFILVARAANVFSCAYILNLARPPHSQIPRQYQVALWYSGLRGAMAFALALQSVHDLPEGHGETIFTATTSIVILTVLLIGGSTGTMLEALQVVGDSNRYRHPYEASAFAVFNSNR